MRGGVEASTEFDSQYLITTEQAQVSAPYLTHRQLQAEAVASVKTAGWANEQWVTNDEALSQARYARRICGGGGLVPGTDEDVDQGDAAWPLYSGVASSLPRARASRVEGWATWAPFALETGESSERYRASFRPPATVAIHREGLVTAPREL